MNADSGRSGHPQILVAGLCLYAVLSLVSMAAMSIGAGLLGLCIIRAFWGQNPWARARALFTEAPPSTRAFAWSSLAFIVACVLSLVAARIWPLEITGRSAHFEILKDSAKAWYFVWPFILWFALSACTLKERRKILLAWFVAFAILSAIGIPQHYTGWPRRQGIPPDLKRFHATLFLGHHLSVASVFIFPFFALLDLSFTRSLENPRDRWNSVRWICVAIGLSTLFLTFSRTLWIALPIGLLFWGFLRLGKRGKVALLAVSVLLAVTALQVPRVRQQLSAQRGVQTREDLWEANWDFFRERPVLGVGLKLNQELSGYYLMRKYATKDVFQGHAHDDVLDILGSMGSVGLLVFIAWWVALVMMVVSAIRSAPARSSGTFFAEGLLAALLVFQLNGLTQVNFWEAKVQHQLMWMAAWALLWCGEARRGVERT